MPDPAPAPATAAPAKPLRIRLIGAAILWVLGILVSLTPPVERVDLALADIDFALLRQLAPHPVPNDIDLVGIDEATLRSPADPPAVWQRQLAHLLRGLAIAKPRAVILDAGLPERSLGTQEDTELAEALAAVQAAAPLVVAVQRDASGALREIHPVLQRQLKPDSTGAADLPTDRDGHVRRFAFFAGEPGKPVETVIARAARAVSPIIYHAPAMIDFALGEKFEYLPLTAALEITTSTNTDAIRRQFGGKIVVVGTILLNADRVVVPMNLLAGDRPAGTTPAVIVRAQALRTLLHGEPIMPVPDWMAWPFYLLPAWLFMARRSRGLWLFAPLLLALAFAAKAAAIHLGQDPPVAGLMIAVGLALVAWMIYDGRTEAVTRREARERPAGPATLTAPTTLAATRALPAAATTVVAPAAMAPVPSRPDTSDPAAPQRGGGADPAGGGGGGVPAGGGGGGGA